MSSSKRKLNPDFLSRLFFCRLNHILLTTEKQSSVMSFELNSNREKHFQRRALIPIHEHVFNKHVFLFLFTTSR